MREIKFRAWHKKRKEMVYFTNFCIGETYEQMWSNNGSFSYCDDSDGDMESWSEFMQYTCLKDKNGKEIYEGDLVRVYGGMGAPLKIIFNQGCFSVEGGGLAIALFEVVKETEIIGNIYENPELLEH